MRSDIYIKHVLDKVGGLMRSGLWSQRVRARAWLNNFDEKDQAVAAFLLDQLCFSSEFATERVFASAFDRMARGPWTNSRRPTLAQLSGAVVCPVEGEDPNRADSGNLMCRLARQVVGISEDRIVEPARACAEAERGNPVILVDDFIGSGAQLIRMLQRRYGTRATLGESLNTGAPLYYLSAVATTYGSTRIRNTTPIELFVGHELDRSYSLNTDEFRASATDRALAADVEPLLEKYAARLCPKEAHMKKPAERKYGFHQLSLAVAFSHSVPDATLPLIWAPGPTNDWTPLVERR